MKEEDVAEDGIKGEIPKAVYVDEADNVDAADKDKQRADRVLENSAFNRSCCTAKSFSFLMYFDNIEIG